MAPVGGAVDGPSAKVVTHAPPSAGPPPGLTAGATAPSPSEGVRRIVPRKAHLPPGALLCRMHRILCSWHAAIPSTV